DTGEFRRDADGGTHGNRLWHKHTTDIIELLRIFRHRKVRRVTAHAATEQTVFLSFQVRTAADLVQ
ncbi:hypothetical protein, partial [Serratia bockelmannii]|uniref:hypothetical protein n=1 Tax=Serratia bockelmannii TaxID=2703793 RepID=UPI003CECE9A6